MHRLSSSFEDLLDSCITAIQEQGKTVEDCLALYPADREGLEPLLRLVPSLQTARTLKAPPEFRRTAAVRMSNLIAARPREVEQPAKRLQPLRDLGQKLRLVFGARLRSPATVTITVFVAMLLFGGGAVYASAGALPGDLLYPVKTIVEDVRLVVSLSDVGDAELHLAFASRRLEEAEALLERNRLQDVKEVLVDYQAQLESALVFLENSGLSPDEQVALAELLVTRLDRHQARLTRRLDRVPEDVRPAVELTLAASQAALNQALEVVDSEPGQEDPALLLTATPTARPTPTPSPEPPTATATATPSPMPSSTPTPTPKKTWPIPTWWPPECPVPPDWPEEWPPDCPIPTEWPSGWPKPPYWSTPTPWLTPETWPVPTWWPPECPVPPDWPDEWPPDCPIPTEWPPGWPKPPYWSTPTPWPTPETWLVPTWWPPECPVPPDWPDEWPPDCPIPTEWPPGWPEPRNWPSEWPEPTWWPSEWPVPTEWPTLPSEWPTPPPVVVPTPPPEWPAAPPEWPTPPVPPSFP